MQLSVKPPLTIPTSAVILYLDCQAPGVRRILFSEEV